MCLLAASKSPDMAPADPSFRKSWGRRSSIDLIIKARGGVPGVEPAVDEARSVLRALRHTAFRDPDPSPPTSIEQYFGRTTAGRPLTITVTVREPRTAPSDATLRRFVASVLPA